MGRGLTKRVMGNTSGTGKQVQVTAYVPTGSSAVTGYLVKEKSDVRYLCHTAQGEGVCNITTGTVTIGKFSIGATDSLGNTYKVAKISSNVVTLFQATGSTHEFANGAKVGYNLVSAHAGHDVVLDAA
jgi:hypothetical protein